MISGDELKYLNGLPDLRRRDVTPLSLQTTLLSEGAFALTAPD